jgi:hypothetical protein
MLEARSQAFHRASAPPGIVGRSMSAWAGEGASWENDRVATCLEHWEPASTTATSEAVAGGQPAAVI